MKYTGWIIAVILAIVFIVNQSAIRKYKGTIRNYKLAIQNYEKAISNYKEIIYKDIVDMVEENEKKLRDILK